MDVATFSIAQMALNGLSLRDQFEKQTYRTILFIYLFISSYTYWLILCHKLNDTETYGEYFKTFQQ